MHLFLHNYYIILIYLLFNKTNTYIFLYLNAGFTKVLVEILSKINYINIQLFKISTCAVTI